MNASNSSMFETTLGTRVIKLGGSGNNPWVVCTLDAVPVILARFTNRETAVDWQNRLRTRARAA
ncbi:MAG: hypothetical protein MK085_12530 [Phycisphaerales bacterium]|nr:hypothetical protein [Phycisphaerales bacterium]